MIPGFLTACLPGEPLERVASWASENGFKALELAAWPDEPGRPWQAHHVPARGFDRRAADAMLGLLAEAGLSISALAYYENNLHPDPGVRAGTLGHLHAVIDAASLLGVELVGTFAGARPDRTPKENVREIGEVFGPLVEYAAARNVRLMIENCPMENWVQFGLPGNYAFSPELWDAVFDAVGSERLGLNLDPSHLHWLGIDPARAVRDYADRIFHVHAKDAEVLPEGRQRFSILANQLGDNPWVSGWWRYRIPGSGAVDWAGFLGALREAGYDGSVSIEHEDPSYEGSPEAVREGLRVGLGFLAPLL